MKSSGFTLIELMIAMLLTIIIMVVALTVMTGLQTYSESNLNIVRMRQEVRYGLFAITGLLKDAGNRIPKAGTLISNGCFNQNTDTKIAQAQTDTLSFLCAPDGNSYPVQDVTSDTLIVNYENPVGNQASVLQDFGTPDNPNDKIGPFLCIYDGATFWVVQVDPNANPGNTYTMDANTVTIKFKANGAYLDYVSGGWTTTSLTLPTNGAYPITYKATMRVTRVIPYTYRVKFGTLQRKAGLYNDTLANNDSTDPDWNPSNMIPGKVTLPMPEQANDDKGFITLASWIWDLQCSYIALDGTIVDDLPASGINVDSIRGVRVSLLGISPKTEIMIRREASKATPGANDVPQVRPGANLGFIGDHPTSTIKTFRRNYFLISTVFLRNQSLRGKL